MNPERQTYRFKRHTIDYFHLDAQNAQEAKAVLMDDPERYQEPDQSIDWSLIPEATIGTTDLPGTLTRIRTEQMGFLTPKDVAELAGHPEGRLIQCLIRTGRGRLTCAAQDVNHYKALIEVAGEGAPEEFLDWVRDVSLVSPPNVLADTVQRLLRCTELNLDEMEQHTRDEIERAYATLNTFGEAI